MVKSSADIDQMWARCFPSFPVVLCSAEHEGKRSIITLGMVHEFSMKPPIIGIGIAPPRFTYGLIKGSGVFVINIPTRSQFKEVMFCGTKSGKNVDKFKECNFTPVKGDLVKAPLISQCPVNLECRVVKDVEVGDHVWFCGEVVKIHRDDSFRREDALEYWAGEFRVMGELVGKR